MPPRVFLDLETTGLDPGSDRVIEIGAVPQRDGTEPYHRLLDPGDAEIAHGAFETHGYTKEMLAGKPAFADVAAEVAEFLRGCELVAHNARFDVEFLDAEFARLGMPQVSEVAAKVTDTLEMAKSMFPGARNSLDSLAAKAGIDVKERRPRHSALVDAGLLAEVYAYLTSGQTELELPSEAASRSFDLPEGIEISVVRIPPDPGAAERHGDYLRFMQEQSGVVPLELDAGKS